MIAAEARQAEKTKIVSDRERKKRTNESERQLPFDAAFLASLDVSDLSAKERENHSRFMELFDSREKAMSKMKGLIPDNKTIGELMEIELQMQPLAKRERKALLGALTKELGYAGDDGAVVAGTIEGIFDCTSSGGLGGLADMGGLMEEGVEIQPGVSVETRVIGL